MPYAAASPCPALPLTRFPTLLNSPELRPIFLWARRCCNNGTQQPGGAVRCNVGHPLCAEVHRQGTLDYFDRLAD